ncbi:SNF2-related protein [Microcoleus vaginatus]|uniref:SNF2-related protein n=2 Tax=Microcoleus vaginatus TaxID=119532 RepID=UPI0040407FF1
MGLIRNISRQITKAASGVRTPACYLIREWIMEPPETRSQSFRIPIPQISDNLCLTISKVRVSKNLLPVTPSVHQIIEPFQVHSSFEVSDSLFIPRPNTFDCTDLFSVKNWTSKNLVELIPQPDSFEYDYPIAQTPISENLFEPFEAEKPKGKAFEDETQQLRRNLSNLGDDEKLRLIEQAQKDYSLTKQVDFWDLLKPLLQPPLLFNFPDELDLYQPLRGYQQEGIGWLVDKSSALLADEMGTGKTVQTVNAIRLLFRKGKIKSALIVCPPAVIGSVGISIETEKPEGWSGHFYLWAPELLVTVIRGSREHRKLAWETPVHVYITTYDTIRNDLSEGLLTDLNKFDCVALDEAQNIKNKNSGRSKAVRQLQAQYRWALTGTPIENSIEDVKSLFEFIEPGFFNSGINYSNQEIKDTIKPYMLRRLKQEVLKDLPDKTYQENWLDLDDEQRNAYNNALNAGRLNIKNSLGNESQVQTHIFALIGKLKQICNFAEGKDESPKTERLLEYLETIVANNQKVLIFSQYVLEGVDKLAKLLGKQGIRFVLYKGGMSEQERNQVISDFRSKPDVNVFLATIKSVGFGVTLTEASYVIHFDHPWNPAQMQNAEDRAHRIGQTKKLTVYSFWMKDTIEERIKKKLTEKHLLVENVINPLAVEAVENPITTEEWLDILGIETRQKAKAEPVSKKTVTARKHQRIQQQLDSLQKQYDLLSEKIAALREHSAIESDTAQKFKLERQIENAESERTQLDRQIEDLENKLKAD